MNKFWSETVKRTEPYVPGEQLDDPDIIKLNTNENPYGPSSQVTEAIQSELTRKLHLYPQSNAEELRHEIGHYYDLDKDHIFIGNGSDEVLAFSFMAFFEQHGKIRFPAITYSFYPVYAKLFNIPYEEVPLNRDFTISPEQFFGAEGGVIMANPNALTGLYLNMEAIEEIALNNPERVLIIDEAYIDFAPVSAASMVKRYPNLLIVQTMSKSRSLAGLRVGFAIGDPGLIEALMRIKDSINSYTIDRLAIAGATAAIKDEDYLRETTAKIIGTREWIIPKLKKRGFHVLPSQANFIFISHYKEKAEPLYQALKQLGILVRHFQKTDINNYLRITIGTDEQMAHFLRAIDHIVPTSAVLIDQG
ncbi:histidinol phosphate aminotransferase apoenzyme [Lentibacillus halodurans]|uniref:Histidinol-phosphate aminotransferase n=1 Tax=Lentibacillus halodurans TaxID=237679 RepID=A0A1I0XW92_9BACI|nr:histidinol-phosphate transaminase [Lentibacillus halodurans]SFB05174.1 histidinol phosphate aminotransferase apoenzyme [Lentibacillus halodurans]